MNHKMSCYISSNNERIYVALESSYGSRSGDHGGESDSAAEAEGEAGSGADQRGRIRRGRRTFVGLPNTIREDDELFELNTLMTEWTNQTGCAGVGSAVSGGDGRDAGVLYGRDGGVGDGRNGDCSSRRRTD